MSVVAVIPSRGRPERAWESAQALRLGAHLTDTQVIVAVDYDDPTLHSYGEQPWAEPLAYRPRTQLVTLFQGDTGNLVKATNAISMRVADADPDAIIGNLGDDHVCRTEGWDRMIAEALVKPGIAYGRDGIHDEHLPTAPFISAKIVNALGWYALPTCRHMYIDNVWKDLADDLGVRRYLPDLFIEHMHPAVLKAPTDDGYARANAATEHDRLAYEEWKLKYEPLDVLAVRQALDA